MNRPRVVLLIVAAFLGVVPDAGAQLGGLKKKLKETVGGEKKPEAAQAAAITFSNDLVELTEPILDGLVRGLQTEIALRKEFKAVLATYPTDAQFRICVAQVPLSEEGMKILTANPLPDNATTAQLQEAIQKLTTLLEAVQKKRCPLDPGDWGGDKKEQRLKEIVAKAAEAVGPGPTPGGEGQDGDEAASPSCRRFAAGLGWPFSPIPPC
jgi:hypothetical protein